MTSKIWYITERTHVDGETGELIIGDHKTLKKTHNVISVEKKIEINYLTKKTIETWILRKKPIQLALI